MNLKIASRVVNVLLLITLGLILTLRANHLPRLPIFIAFIAISGFYFVLRLTAIRKKQANARAQVSAFQKVMINILAATVFGTMAALMLMVCHLRYIGFPLLNTSLVIFILCLSILMIAPQKSGASLLSPAIVTITRVTLCLGMIGTFTGMLLRINHFRGGQQLTFSGFLFLAVSIFIIVYANHIKAKKTL